MISSPNYALFWGKHLISPFLGGTALLNLGDISQNTYVLLHNVAFLVYALLRKFSLKKAARGKFLTYSKSAQKRLYDQPYFDLPVLANQNWS